MAHWPTTSKPGWPDTVLDRSEYACLAVAITVVLGGTLAAGLLPQTLPFQVVAGAVIVAGFAVAYACVGAG